MMVSLIPVNHSDSFGFPCLDGYLKFLVFFAAPVLGGVAFWCLSSGPLQHLGDFGCRCCGKANTVGTEFALVGPRRPSK